MVDLGTFSRYCSKTADINDSGQVVGMSGVANGDVHAFLWTASDGMVNLGTLGGDQSEAVAINNAGQVERRPIPPAERNTPFCGRRRTVWLIWALWAEREAEALDINDAGQVVGTDTQ